MNRTEVISILQGDKNYLSEKFGVVEIGLFGSYARNQQRDDSDIDILVKLREPKLKALVGVFDFLEKKLNKKIDIVIEGSHLSERFRRLVKHDIIYV